MNLKPFETFGVDMTNNEAIKAAVVKAIGKGDVPVGTHDLSGTRVIVDIESGSVTRGQGTAGDGFDTYVKTIGISTKAALAAAISFAGIQGDNIEAFLKEAYRMSVEENKSGSGAIESMRNIEDAMQRVETYAQTMTGTRRTATRVSLGDVSVTTEERSVADVG